MNPETLLRLGSFFAIFTAVAVWERVASRRPLRADRTQRWTTNLTLVGLNTLLLRLLFPLAATGAALWADQHNLGLLHQLPLPGAAKVVLAVVALDFAIYVQHVLFHAMPTLWRLHRMHHADVDLDVTSGTRFHPIEMILSMLIKMAVVVSIGAPVAAVVAFEVILNGMAMFNHGNIALPTALDAALRWLVVTPDVHRVHHSVHVDETNTNYGFNLSIWDRLFGTFRDQPRDGHLGTVLGVPPFEDVTVQTLPWLLALPFQGEHADQGESHPV